MYLGGEKMRLFRIITILSILAIIFHAGSAGAVPVEEWNRTFGGTGSYQVDSVQQTVDEGYILAGMVRSYGYDRSYALLIKTDHNGNETWNRTFGNDTGKFSSAWSVQQTSEGGYILAGEISPSGTGSYEALLIKTDANGSEQWNKTFRRKDSTEARSVQQTRDGGYILAGRTYKTGFFYGKPRDDILLIKTDSNGSEQWSRVFEGTGDDLTYSVQKTTDDGYILAGWATSQQTTWYGAQSFTFEAWLLKTDVNGSQQWKKSFGETKTSSQGIGLAYGPLTAQQTSDGGFILAGSMFWDKENRNPVWLIKVDADGNQQWKKKLGPGWVMSVHQSRDDGYILAGRTSDDIDNSKAWLIKTDTNGNEQWNSTFGRTINGTINSIHQTFDGGCILAGTGYMGSYNVSDSDAWLIKVGKEPSEAARIPTTGRTEKVSGFEIVLAITTLSAVYVFGRNRK